MDRLYTTLGDSVDFFNEIDSSFEEETKAVRTYATAAVMEELWKCKVAATEAGSTEIQDKNSHLRHRSHMCGPSLKRSRDVAGKPDHLIQPATAAKIGFNGYLQRIDHDILDAIYCRWPLEKPESYEESPFCMDTDSLQRLRDKIWVQDQALRQITNKIYRTRPCLKEVIKECDMLLVYMEKTKELWQIHKKGKNTEPVFSSF
ncbi:hypothetical protein PHISCL_08392 [Aspergillus sclerotialis]|uniref:Uncharacterized protein n=1 Tax=Aspergillus sclerotialis TaxID=2070753 RepID=A0A3A2ZAM0_9EURO|nr:hypothetical protein PHISCL_08392 [Aspergillus sclerotialis]